MKRRSLKSLALRKTVVSSLKTKIAKGGGESHFNTVCPFCNTDKELCNPIDRREL